MKPKVEIACMHLPAKNIVVDASERVCINCIWYERRFREGRSNIDVRSTTSSGYCLYRKCERGPLYRPCGHFERE